MAVGSYGVNDTNAVKLWSRKLQVEALRATPIRPLIGTSSDSVIQLKNEVKDTGDKVTFSLRMQLTGDGVSEGERQEGNEEALSLYADSLVINELMHAVRVKNNKTIDAQRIPFNLRNEAKDGLRDWWAKRYSVTFFNQVCGYTPQTNVKYTGLNTVTAPSTGRQIWTEAGATGDQDLDSTGDTFKLVHLDYAKELAQTSTATGSPIRPLMIDGEEKYVAYIHPFSVTDLRTDASTAGNWFDIQKAAMQGGKVSNNPIYSGALGEYNGIIIRQSFDVPQGVNSSTGAAISSVRRNVLLGAQAAVMAFGGIADSPTEFNWVEELFDYEREFGVMAGTMFGMKKTRFNSVDFGSVVISSYAAAHT